MGGALATLAAYDLKGVASNHNLDVQVSCYTFGAPRVGNHAFAEDFDTIINDCFHVVNHQVIIRFRDIPHDILSLSTAHVHVLTKKSSVLVWVLSTVWATFGRAIISASF